MKHIAGFDLNDWAGFCYSAEVAKSKVQQTGERSERKLRAGQGEPWQRAWWYVSLLVPVFRQAHEASIRGTSFLPLSGQSLTMLLDWF